MSGALTLFDRLLGRLLPSPCAVAAVAILSSQPAARPPPDGLERGLAAVAPQLTTAERAGWVLVMAALLSKFGISGPRCLAAFLGQCAVESGGFLGLEENLSYSAARLCQVWPNRFPSMSLAEACAFQPETLANQVYADRLGNGDPSYGDGWRFCGRGLIQLSGRTNYQRFAAALGIDLEAAIRRAGTQAGAAECAAWFWSAHGLSELAASWSIDLISRKINGGNAGAAERVRLCNAALHAIGE